jgi:histidine triad (HIT) family protein
MVDQDKIMDIAKQLQGLDQDEQQKKFQELVKDYNPEEQKEIIEKLTGGNQECPFCSMVEGKIPVKKVYEDQTIMAVLDINPATKGHIIVFPKKHATLLSQVDDNIVGQLFKVANMLSTAVFDIVKAEGTNIVVSNGSAAGQRGPHVVVNVIPRFADDKVSIAWNGDKASDEELEELRSAIASKIKIVEVGAEPVEDQDAKKLEPRIP